MGLARMRGWTFRAALFAGLGGATTLGVAWAIAAWAPRADWSDAREVCLLTDNGCVHGFEIDSVGRGVAGGFEAPDSSFRRRKSVDVQMDRAWWRRFAVDPRYQGIGGGWSVRAYGWPRYAMRLDELSDGLGGPRLVAYAIPLQRQFTRLRIRALPLQVLRSGFVVNSVVFGAGWFAALTSLGTVSRLVRRRRGRCPACDYDLKHDFAAGCPECGWNRAAR